MTSKRVFGQVDECDWCGINYPKGGFTYYSLLVHNPYKDTTELHKICGDCYEQLKETE